MSSPGARLPRTTWQPAEDEKLLRLVQEAGSTVEWQEIADALPGRSARQCCRHWWDAVDPSIKKGPWSAEENNLLAQLHEKFGNSWGEISKRIAGRTCTQCRSHWQSCLDPSIKKGPWAIEEDRNLARLQEEFGNSWTDISKRIAGRSESQCRARWYNGIDPSVKKGHWTIEEDDLLLQLHEKFGGSWVQISKRMPGRSEKQCRRRGKTVLKARSSTQGDSPRARVFWTIAEDETMLRLVQEAGPAVNWKAIADALPGRTAKLCRAHWTLVLDPSIKREPWSTEEESLLEELHEQFGGKFVEISKRIPGRPHAQCRNQWNKKLKALCAEKNASVPGDDGVPVQLQESSLPENTSTRANSLTTEEDRQLEQPQTRVWTFEEDDSLNRLHSIHGNSWGLIARHMSGRSHLQCRARWLDVLNPALATGSWTNDEDAELVRRYGEYGKQWSLIAECIPGHDEFECRNRSLEVVGHEAWTSAEDAILRRLNRAHGPDWDNIAVDIANRTSLQCKYRALVLLDLPAHKHARPENNAQAKSPVRKSARLARYSNISGADGSGGNSARPADNENDGCAAGGKRSEEVGSTSTPAEKCTRVRPWLSSPAGSPVVQHARPARRSSRLRRTET